MGLQERLAEGLLDAHPTDAAQVLEALPLDEGLALLERSTPESVAEVLRRLAPQRAGEVLASLSPTRAGEVIGRLDLDVAARLLRLIEADRSEAICAQLPERRARGLLSLLRFPEQTAGALMDPQVLALPQDLEAKEAVERVREAAAMARYNLYILDREQRLVGVLNLRELLLARPDTQLGSIMKARVATIPARATPHQILAHPGWREVHQLPVVDENGAYLGAIRYRTLRRLEAEQAGRDGAGGTTVVALGDLFSTGAAGLLEALASLGDTGGNGHG